MSLALPVASGEDAIKALAKTGFRSVGKKGNHVTLRNSRSRRWPR